MSNQRFSNRPFFLRRVDFNPLGRSEFHSAESFSDTLLARDGDGPGIARAIAAEDKELHDSLQVTDPIAHVQGGKDSQQRGGHGQAVLRAALAANAPIASK